MKRSTYRGPYPAPPRTADASIVQLNLMRPCTLLPQLWRSCPGPKTHPTFGCDVVFRRLWARPGPNSWCVAFLPWRSRAKGRPCNCSRLLRARLLCAGSKLSRASQRQAISQLGCGKRSLQFTLGLSDTRQQIIGLHSESQSPVRGACSPFRAAIDENMFYPVIKQGQYSNLQQVAETIGASLTVLQRAFDNATIERSELAICESAALGDPSRKARAALQAHSDGSVTLWAGLFAEAQSDVTDVQAWIEKAKETFGGRTITIGELAARSSQSPQCLNRSWLRLRLLVSCYPRKLVGQICVKVRLPRG